MIKWQIFVFSLRLWFQTILILTRFIRHLFIFYFILVVFFYSNLFGSSFLQKRRTVYTRNNNKECIHFPRVKLLFRCGWFYRKAYYQNRFGLRNIFHRIKSSSSKRINGTDSFDSLVICPYLLSYLITRLDGI